MQTILDNNIKIIKYGCFSKQITIVGNAKKFINLYNMLNMQYIYNILKPIYLS